VAYFADLSPCTYGGDPLHLDPYRPRIVPPPVAVGWLDENHEFARGPVDPTVRAKLGELFANPWEWGSFRGFHGCGLCERDWDEKADPEGRGIAKGVKNLLVPGKGVQYFTPHLILHYIEHHAYQPPAEFCDAVVACPLTVTDEYFSALFASAGPRYVREFARVLAGRDSLPENRWNAARLHALATRHLRGQQHQR
jgi:hypothetical protein